MRADRPAFQRIRGVHPRNLSHVKSDHPAVRGQTQRQARSVSVIGARAEGLHPKNRRRPAADRDCALQYDPP